MCPLLVYQEYCAYYVEPVCSTSFVFFAADCTQLRHVLFYVEQHGVTPHWKKLGVYLGILLFKLNVIETDHGKADDCMMAMLDLWLRTGTATKQELIDALIKITKS